MAAARESEPATATASPRTDEKRPRKLTGALGHYILRLLQRLPLPAARALTTTAAGAAYWLVPRIRRVGLANLDLAYGDSLSPREKRRILKGAVRNAAIVAAELAHTPRISPESMKEHVRVEGLEHVPQGQGAVLFGAHLGNWEWMAAAMVSRGIKTGEVVRPLNHPKLNAHVNGLRRAAGIETVAKYAAGTELKRLLREGYLVGVLADQSPRENGVPVRFFGAPCWATIGPVMLAMRGRTNAVPISCRREGPGRYCLRFYPPVEMTRSGDFLRDLVENTQRCQDAIEVMVREAPEQWLWLHRRWKPRPRIEAEWEARKSRESVRKARTAEGTEETEAK